MIREKRDALFRKLSGRSSPVRIQIEVTRKCNLRCVHCVLDHSKPAGYELGPADYEKLLPQMKEAGVFTLNLTGGELYTHPEIDDILDIILSSDFHVTLQTNGVLITEERVEKLAAAGANLRCVSLSLYGVNASTHEKVTRVAGSHERTLNSIKALVEAGINTEVSTLLMTVNHKEYRAVADFCEEIGARHSYYSLIIPREGGGTEPLEYRLTEEMLRKLPRPWETFAMDFMDLDPDDYTSEKSLDQWCTMGRTNGFITSGGDVLPCSIVNIPAGNVREKSFYQIWRSSAIMKNIRSLKIGDFECSDCGYFPKCRPCPGLGLYEHEDMFTAPTEVCRIVKIFLGEGDGTNDTKNRKTG